MPHWIKPLFWVAAAYDFIAGGVFLLFGGKMFDRFEIVPPNHMGYVHFSAAVVAIFGVGFYFVALDPLRNRDLIKLGILLKLSYAGTVFYHYFASTMPGLWIPFAWMDLGFAVLFAVALSKLSPPPPA